MLLSAVPKASAATVVIYKNLTITSVTVHNKPGAAGSLIIKANIDICPGTDTIATIYNDTTNSADFRNTSAWFMAAYLAGKKMDMQVTSLDASPNMCRVEYIWIS
jgi:hypothetical protein